MFVKICGITSEEDALLAVAMDADAVGFIFAPSTRQVSATRVYDITRRLPPEILTIGVFRDETPKRVIEIAHKAGVKGVQLHGRETPAQVAEVAAAIPFVIKVYAAGVPQVADAGGLATNTIMLDGSTPGSGHVFDWSLAGEVPEGVRLILAGGLGPDNVADAVQTVNPWGVDAATGVEAAPGKKDALKIKHFVERARAAAPTPYVAEGDLFDWSLDDPWLRRS